MLRAKFLFNFSKFKPTNSQEIVKYSSNEKSALQEKINIKILEINQKISENSKALIEAQIIKIRSTFSKPNNLFEKIGKNIYKTKLEESIIWYQQELKDLYLSRRELEINLEKIKGIFWLNQIKRFIRIIFIGFLFFFSLFIFLSGFVIMIYLLPLIILIFLGYFLFNKR